MILPIDGPNQSMKPTAPIAKQPERICHDTLPWLISVSLGLMRVSEKLNQT